MEWKKSGMEKSRKNVEAGILACQYGRILPPRFMAR
jgi:hypothetical protein